MGLLTRSSVASMDTSTAQFAPQIPGLIAGEALDIAAPCYIKAADGKVYMTDATAANEAAKVHGFTPRAVGISQACTLYGVGTRFGYGSALTPGAPYYAGATAGRLDTAATPGCAFPVAYAVSATDIVVVWANGAPLTSATIGAGTITVTELANDAVETAIIKNDAVTTAKILNANVTAAKIADGVLTPGKVAESAADAVIGAIPVLYRVAIAAGANASKNVTITNKIVVSDVWVVLKGAGVLNETIQVLNAGNAITNAMAAGGSDGDIVRAASIVTAQAAIADSGTLRVTCATGATQPDAEVYVLGVRVA